MVMSRGAGAPSDELSAPHDDLQIEFRHSYRELLKRVVQLIIDSLTSCSLSGSI